MIKQTVKRINVLLLGFLILGISNQASNAQNYLSSLSATKNDPLYTTYAAALNRSEFVIDEGYHFDWYAPDKGITFENEKAGSLGLGFKLNGFFQYRLGGVYREPVVTTSYSDLVRYYYYPFENIRVEVFFLVYSSRIAIQDVKIKNEGASTVRLSVYPFLDMGKNEAADAELIPERDGLTFKHKELPDGWTKSHGIPYQKERLNAYIIDASADAWGAYSKLTKSAVSGAIAKKKASQENYCVEWGTVHTADGSLCTLTPPRTQQIIEHNGSDAEILTEEAPKWGETSPNIPGNGYQGCELGNFDSPAIAQGDSFQVIFTSLATGEQGTGRGIIPPLPAKQGVIVNIQLKKTAFPPVPQKVKATFYGGRTAFIQWKKEKGYTYNLYRRNARTEKGKYKRIAAGIKDSLYYDFTLDSSEKYGYIVIARDSAGRFSGHSADVNNLGSADFLSDVSNDRLSDRIPGGSLKVVALQKNFTIPPGGSALLRILRGVAKGNAEKDSLISACRNLRRTDLQPFVEEDERLYRRIPRLNFTNADYKMMYWSAFSMMRQCMLPPEGQSSYNYYVFSREPTWGWGHGGQVFHESLSMLAYVFMDPVSAMNSQRVYMERQWKNGYINYRTGPYLNETIPYHNQYTTSAPWFNWENWEIFKVSRDTVFLKEAYQSGKKFYQFWLNNRDANHDGLCEWGAHAVLESVRDGKVAVWDQVGWPSNFDALDLNAMLVNEAQSLGKMAQKLGYSEDYDYWKQEAAARTDSINRYMWDSQTGFYYNINKNDHSFTFKTADDLKRMEIIGFLPLWAGIADQAQAAKLMQHLTNPREFRRKFGIPSLSAADSYYQPMGYWNGPVWVQWQYLIFRGLLRYGYEHEARQLTENVFSNVIHQLKTSHYFWELYSPDAYRAGFHKTYIWTGIVARMLLDTHKMSQDVKKKMKK